MPPEDVFIIDGHPYELGRIAMAVQKREGHNSCGIRQGKGYVSLPKDQGLRLCADKLGKQLDKDDFRTVMRRWKGTDDNFEHYLADIKYLLVA